MTRQDPRKHFDQPVVRGPESIPDFVPPKAITPEEIARRRKLFSGTLLAEHQERGTRILGGIIEKLDDAESIHIASGIAAITLWNTGWFVSARRSKDAMRRRTILPPMAKKGETVRMSEEDLRVRINTSFDVLAEQAAATVRHRTEARIVGPHEKAFGQKLGNTALELAALHHGIAHVGGDPVEVQDQMMIAAMMNVQEAHNLGMEIQAVPAVAQMAYEDSPLMVNFRQRSTTELRQAITDTVGQIGYAPR